MPMLLPPQLSGKKGLEARGRKQRKGRHAGVFDTANMEGSNPQTLKQPAHLGAPSVCWSSTEEGDVSKA